MMMHTLQQAVGPLVAMRAIQQQAANLVNGTLGAETVTAVTESIADRVQRIRAKMLAVGIPTAVGSGVFTTLTFAGAFGLARTERVWAPALLLGGVATLAGLVSVALAARIAETVATPTATTVIEPAARAAFY